MGFWGRFLQILKLQFQIPIFRAGEIVRKHNKPQTFPVSYDLKELYNFHLSFMLVCQQHRRLHVQ